ncbi:MAG: response regulator [bacterium]|jgi:putative two-component system response regulator
MSSKPTSTTAAEAQGSAERRPLVLVADDSEDIRALLGTLLKRRYEVRTAADGNEAILAAAKLPRPDLILLDVEMPGKSGHDVCALLKTDPATAPIPVIFITGRSDPKDEAKGFAVGAVDYVPKPLSPPIVMARVAAQLALTNQRHQLEHLVAERTRELQEARSQLIERLARALSYREGGLSGRPLRVGQYARLIAEAAGEAEDSCELIGHAAPLADIGKLGVPEVVLRNADQYSTQDWEEMRRHCEIGAEIIGEHLDPLLAAARAIALTHHERWDGQGYPKGLKGETIPMVGRIVAVADSFEAMTATQRRRQPMSVEDAARVIASEAGKQFDPAIVEAFKKALPKIAAVRTSIRDELEGIHNLDFSASAPSTASKPGAKPGPRPPASAPKRGPAG